jgi:hypothetical protein
MRTRISREIQRLLHNLQIPDILSYLKIKAPSWILGKRSAPMKDMWFQFITLEPRFAGLVPASTGKVQAMGSYSKLEVDQTKKIACFCTICLLIFLVSVVNFLFTHLYLIRYQAPRPSGSGRRRLTPCSLLRDQACRHSVLRLDQHHPAEPFLAVRRTSPAQSRCSGTSCFSRLSKFC